MPVTTLSHNFMAKWRILCCMSLIALVGIIVTSCAMMEKLESTSSKSVAMEKDPKRVAALLTSADAWIMPQPKEVRLTGQGFNFIRSGLPRLVGSKSTEAEKIAKGIPDMLMAKSGFASGSTGGRPIVMGVFPDGKLTSKLRGISESELKDLGPEGYVLHVDRKGASLAATTPAGLRHAARTLAQLATDRDTFPGLHIRDWPSMKIRGMQQDVCRGQVPTVETIKRLTRVLAEAKMNVMELYIEHTYKFKAHPDSSPPEGYTPEDAREMFKYAASMDIEVHPMFQVLGHAGTIISKPQFLKYAVRNISPEIWKMTYDIRKPETVDFVMEMVKELQETMPSKLFNVDITEIDAEGFIKTGTKNEDIGKMIYDYVVKLQKLLNKTGTRLVIAQGPLGSEGFLGGLGAYIDKLPRETVVASYYCAGGVYQPAWEKDFPRMKAQKIDFFAMPWIYSHVRLMPWSEGSLKFSDLEVSRGLMHGALGSITTDWGDEGHFHFVGQEWYPVLYHGASAWTGAQMDRDYFNQAFGRLLYGIKDDSVARAMNLATSIYGKNIPLRNEKGEVAPADPMNIYLWGFFNDPWEDTNIKSMADRVATGQQILEAENPALDLIQKASGQATRNQDNLEQLLFGIRNYQAMGKKFIVSGHYLDAKIPRAQVIQELEEVVRMYETSKADFQRMWLAEDRDNANYRGMTTWYDRTILPCKQKIEELKKAGQ